MRKRSLTSLLIILGSIVWALQASASPFGSSDKNSHKSSSTSKTAKDTKQAQKNVAGNKPATKPSGAQKLTDVPPDFDELPTFIKSNSLSVNSDKHVFQYLGNVEVKKGDMTLTSETLDGAYDENNQIKTLVARNNVVITKGDSIRATSKTATYEKSTDTMVLTDSPEIHQNDSILTADIIKIFLQENRSVAEGQVNMKLVKPKAIPSPSPTPAVSSASPTPTG
jgi:lipopolysaccharide transport protein LptA